MKTRLVICGLGDGGCNGTIQDALVFKDHITQLRKVRQEAFADQLLEAVSFLLLNTNKDSMFAHQKIVSDLGLTVSTHVVGEKVARGIGTGQDWKLGRRAMEESLKIDLGGALPTAEAIKLNFALGEGGTCLGGCRLLTHYCRKRGLLAIPVITTATFDYDSISFAQSEIVEKEVQGFVDDKISFTRLRTSALYERHPSLTRKNAFATMDRHQARLSGGLVRVLAQPTEYDRMNLLRQLYTNIGQQPKRWLMASQTLPNDGYATVALERAIEEMVQAHYCQFDRHRAGGGVLIIETENLPLAAYKPLIGKLQQILNGAYQAHTKTNKGNPNLHIKDVTFPNGDPSHTTFSLWMAEFTGLPDADQVPAISWLSPEDFTMTVQDSETEKPPAVQAVRQQVIEPEQQMLKEEPRSKVNGTPAVPVDQPRETPEPKVEPTKSIITLPPATAPAEINYDFTADNLKKHVFPKATQSSDVNLEGFAAMAKGYPNEYIRQMFKSNFVSAFLLPVRELHFKLANKRVPPYTESDFTYCPKAPAVEQALPFLASREICLTASEFWKDGLFDIYIKGLDPSCPADERIELFVSFDAVTALNKYKKTRITDQTSSEELAHSHLSVIWDVGSGKKVERCFAACSFFGWERYQQLWAISAAQLPPVPEGNSLLLRGKQFISGFGRKQGSVVPASPPRINGAPAPE